MRRGCAVLALSAALAGCSGGGIEAADRPVARATLDATDTEMFSDCPPITVRRLARAEIAFSGVLSIEGYEETEWVVEVDRWFTGGDEDVMVIHSRQPGIGYFADTVSSGDEPGEVGERPQDGDRLLVAGPGLTRRALLAQERAGYASACLTREWTPGLAQRFERAFPTPAPRPYDDAGFRVVEADDGPSALRRIQDDRPTLVVLDLSLPGFGGLDVRRLAAR